MTEPLRVDLFVEDRAHEEFIRAVVQRVIDECGAACTTRVRSARGGHGKALSELTMYQEHVLRNPGLLDTPDVLVVAIDANCQTYRKVRDAIEHRLRPEFQPRAAIACPDPHIERWYMADVEAFHTLVGWRPRLPSRKCERRFYKKMLAEAVVRGGHPPTLGGVEFAADIAAAMNLYGVGKVDVAFKHFIESLKALAKPHGV